MEFIRDQIRYTITQTPTAVKVDAVDFTSLHNLGAVIDPRKYECVRTPERLYAILLDGFKGQCKECQLHLIRFPGAGVELNLKVDGYMLKEAIVEMLRVTPGTTENQTLSNKIDWLNQKVVQQQADLNELRALVFDIQKYAPWIRLWRHWVPDGGPYSDRASLVMNSFYCENNNAGCVIRRLEPDYPLIKIVGVYIISGADEVIVNMDNYPNYPVIDFLRLCNPKEIIITGDDALKGKAKIFIEEHIQCMNNLEKITVGTNITTVRAICELPRLVELVLRNCTKIHDLEKLEHASSLKMLHVTADIKNIPPNSKFAVSTIK